MKILIVEDDALMRDSLNKLLTISGHDVVCAHDGKHALQKLEEKDIDLLITDLLMPELSGHKLISLSKQRYPDLPIIAMTGYLDEIGKLDKEKDKPDFFLQKPFKLEELEAILSLLDKTSGGT